ncbi:MAG: cytochrome-c peroxidase [bacterium]
MSFNKRSIIFVYLLILLLGSSFSLAFAQDPSQKKLDSKNLTPVSELRTVLRQKGVSLPNRPEFNDNRSLQRLGSKLFFDQLLSGNRDVACASCHHHNFAFSDGLSLSIGTGSKGFGTKKMITHKRQLGIRNSIGLSHRFLPEMRTMLWDMRITQNQDGTIEKPERLKIPEGIDTIQEVQFLDAFRLNQEMKGFKGQKDIFGDTNRFALVPDTQPRKLFGLIVDRLKNYSRYRKRFRKAYPETPIEEINISHVTNAMLHFLRKATTFLNSPWDKFLKGNDDALSKNAVKGALLFYGKANCSECHSGNLLSDQQTHNIAVPQVQPRFDSEGYDYGRYSVTLREKDRFAFRTPPLRDVELSRPWMHNGAYKTLRGAVKHHINPEQSLRNYRSEQLAQDIQLPMKAPLNRSDLQNLFSRGKIGQFLATKVKNNQATQDFIIKTISPEIQNVPDLSDTEIDRIMSFLRSLTSPSLRMIDRKGDVMSKEPLLERLHTRQFPGHASFAGIHLTTHGKILDELDIPSVDVRYETMDRN